MIQYTSTTCGLLTHKFLLCGLCQAQSPDSGWYRCWVSNQSHRSDCLCSHKSCWSQSHTPKLTTEHPRLKTKLKEGGPCKDTLKQFASSSPHQATTWPYFALYHLQTCPIFQMTIFQLAQDNVRGIQMLSCHQMLQTEKVLDSQRVLISPKRHWILV